jgi:hypothetical protein
MTLVAVWLPRAGPLALAAVAFAAVSGLAACTLGFNRFEPSVDASADGASGDARADGGAGVDARTDGDAGVDDVDAGQPLADGCTGAAQCVGEAGACGSGCGQVSQQCQMQCPNKPCRDGCISAEQTCRSGCAGACTTCALAEGCAAQTACQDAAGAP